MCALGPRQTSICKLLGTLNYKLEQLHPGEICIKTRVRLDPDKLKHTNWLQVAPDNVQLKKRVYKLTPTQFTLQIAVTISI